MDGERLLERDHLGDVRQPGHAGDLPQERQETESLCGAVRTDCVEEVIDPAPAGNLGHPRGDVLAPVIDDLVGPQPLDKVAVVRGAGGDYLETGGLGQLHGEAADTAGATMDEN